MESYYEWTKVASENSDCQETLLSYWICVCVCVWEHYCICINLIESNLIIIHWYLLLNEGNYFLSKGSLWGMYKLLSSLYMSGDYIGWTPKQSCFLVYDAALHGSSKDHKSEFFFLISREDELSSIAVIELLNIALNWSCSHLPLSDLYNYLAQMVNNLPATWETWVQSLGGEDPLEKGMATHHSILAWRIEWTEETDSYSPWGRKESDPTERLTHTHT